jgi:predicted enzyme related to lactoylglutathione lyase
MSMDGQPEGTKPNWSVTFSVDDADASAALAAELGGKVVVEPFDSPPVRMAVVSDPQGAILTVSKFTPPNG